MTNFSYDLIGKLDSNIVHLVYAINKTAENLGIAFFIVGASARDILLHHAHDILPTRATVDIDIGVSVANWTQFKILKETLLNSGLFAATRSAQRLLFRGDFPVDIVPCKTY